MCIVIFVDDVPAKSGITTVLALVGVLSIVVTCIIEHKHSVNNCVLMQKELNKLNEFTWRRKGIEWFIYGNALKI